MVFRKEKLLESSRETALSDFQWQRQSVKESNPQDLTISLVFMLKWKKETRYSDPFPSHGDRKKLLESSFSDLSRPLFLSQSTQQVSSNFLCTQGSSLSPMSFSLLGISNPTCAICHGFLLQHSVRTCLPL